MAWIQKCGSLVSMAGNMAKNIIFVLKINFSVERALNKNQFLLYRVYQHQKRCFENMSVIFRLKVK